MLDAALIFIYLTNELTAEIELPQCLNSLNNSIQGIKNLYFPATDSTVSACTWVHSIFASLASLNPLRWDRSSFHNSVVTIIQNNPDPLHMLSEFDKKCRSHQSGVVKELQLSERDIFVDGFTAEARSKYLWLPRTLFQFSTQFWSHIKANAEHFPLLWVLRQRRGALYFEDAQRTVRIVHYLRELGEAACAKGIRRRDAEKEGSFWTFVKSQGKKFEELTLNFQADFISAFKDLEYFECKPIHDQFNHMSEGIPENMELGVFLPSNNGVGILSMGLWEGRKGNRKKRLDGSSKCAK